MGFDVRICLAFLISLQCMPSISISSEWPAHGALEQLKTMVVGEEEISVLFGGDARIVGGPKELRNGDHVHRLWTENWTDVNDAFIWRLNVSISVIAQVRVLVSSHFKMAATTQQHPDGGSSPVRLRFCVDRMHTCLRRKYHECASTFSSASWSSSSSHNDLHMQTLTETSSEGSSVELTGKLHTGSTHTHDMHECNTSCVLHYVSYVDAPSMVQFQREFLSEWLWLAQGEAYASLQAVENPEFGKINLALLSVELAPKHVLEDLAHERSELCADVTWLRSGVDFGIFLHWNSDSAPFGAEAAGQDKGDKHGKKARFKEEMGGKVSYHRAVLNLDVEALATKIASTGAGLVVLTTSWRGFFFPAPLASVDGVLQGRTTERDLIRELGEGLLARGIRLMLYYHYGKDDPEWWSRAGFGDEAQNERCWDIWINIMQEVGTRYGSLVAGYWIDDAMTGYYSRRPPWRRMYRALKAGYAQRLVGYNPWALPMATVLQELYVGEIAVLDSLSVPGVGQGGVFDSGPHTGLHATFSGLLQLGDWTYEGGDDFPPLSMEIPDLIRGVLEARRRATVPIFNVLISQEGYMCERALAALSEVSRWLRTDCCGVRISKKARGSGAQVALGLAQSGLIGAAEAAAAPSDEPAFAATELGSQLAFSGPSGTEPVYWRKEHALVGWEKGGFAVWKLQAQELKAGDGLDVQLVLKLSPGRATAGPHLTVSLVMGASYTRCDSCQIFGDAAEGDHSYEGGAQTESCSGGTCQSWCGLEPAHRWHENEMEGSSFSAVDVIVSLGHERSKEFFTQPLGRVLSFPQSIFAGESASLGGAPHDHTKLRSVSPMFCLVVRVKQLPEDVDMILHSVHVRVVPTPDHRDSSI